jgi:Ca2+-binding RTX toxin-like protein
VVVENSDRGTDIVRSSVSFTLPENVEILVLEGSNPIFGTGNALNNTIIGNNANNRLDGRGGSDILVGQGGNDVYTVDTATDRITESADGGTDRVEAFVSFTLPDNVEDLVIFDTQVALNATGNALDNFIGGNNLDNVVNGGAGDDSLEGGIRGNDTLIGGAGDDTLTGIRGVDIYVFDSGFAFNSADLGVDFITDFGFSSNSPFEFVPEKIVLDKTTFFTLSSIPGIGFSDPSELAVVGTDQAAATSAADIVYNFANGNLFYNANGTEAGFGIGAQFATVSRAFGIPPFTLTGADFLIQA